MLSPPLAAGTVPFAPVEEAGAASEGERWIILPFLSLFIILVERPPVPPVPDNSTGEAIDTKPPCTPVSLSFSEASTGEDEVPATEVVTGGRDEVSSIPRECVFVFQNVKRRKETISRTAEGQIPNKR